MTELAIALLVLLLVSLAFVARSVLQPLLSLPIAAIAVLGVAAYVSLAVVPWVRSLSWFADADEASLSAPELSDGLERLRLEPIEGQPAFRVLRGAETLGQISAQQLLDAAAPYGLDPPLPDVAAGSAGASLPRPSISPAQGDSGDPQRPPSQGRDAAQPTPEAERPEDEASAPAGPGGPAPRGGAPEARARTEGTDVGDRVEATSLRAPLGPGGSEVQLRARASVLAVEEVCTAADLLKGGQDARTQALARVFRERCQRAR